jgi:hypothetical protein
VISLTILLFLLFLFKYFLVNYLFILFQSPAQIECKKHQKYGLRYHLEYIWFFHSSRVRPSLGSFTNRNGIPHKRREGINKQKARIRIKIFMLYYTSSLIVVNDFMFIHRFKFLLTHNFPNLFQRNRSVIVAVSSALVNSIFNLICKFKFFVDKFWKTEVPDWSRLF